MAAATSSVLDSIKDREFAYVLSGTRLKVVQTIPKLDIGSIHVDPANPGDFLELPRWMAEVLMELGLCESAEESFASEVFKAVNREKMAGDSQIARLSPEFYLKVRRFLVSSSPIPKSNERPPTGAFVTFDLDRTKTLLYDLMTMRIRKILLIAMAQSPPTDIKEKLTPEENQIFNAVYELLMSWRATVMDGR
jgi:GINS complex protein